MLRDYLSTSTCDRLNNYPVLKSVTDDFIINNGVDPDPAYLTDLVVYIRKLNVDEPEFFGWDDETAEDFYTWGHNSRYGNVLEPMLMTDLDFYIRTILDYLDSSGIREPEIPEKI